jgi:hypothetical protein
MLALAQEDGRMRVTLGRCAAIIAAAGMLGLLAPAAGAAPSAEEIIERVVAANAATPDVTSADVLFKLRLEKPLTDPPDCVFDGAMEIEGGRQSVKVGQRSSGLVCWAVNKYVLGRLFEASEPLQGFLARFDFTVLGEKMSDNVHYYLVQGRARDSENNPRGLIGWIDYERGLFTDGTLQYDWGTVDSEQHYSQLNGAWLLTYQFLRTSRYGATLEIEYSNFHFARSGRDQRWKRPDSPRSTAWTASGVARQTSPR